MSVSPGDARGTLTTDGDRARAVRVPKGRWRSSWDSEQCVRPRVSDAAGVLRPVTTGSLAKMARMTQFDPQGVVLRPELAVKAAVLHRFGDVLHADVVAGVQVGDGTAYLQYAVMGAGR